MAAMIKSCFALIAAVCLGAALAQRQPNVAVPSTIDPTVLSSGNPADMCPIQDARQAVHENIGSAVRRLLRQNIPQSIPECGSGRWYPVGFLNMSDPAEVCPSAWMEYSENGIRCCGRPRTSQASCASISYPTGRTYSKVCGQVIGYQISSPAAFYIIFTTAPRSPDDIYVDGVSITHGFPRSHIWTYAAGHSELVNPNDLSVDCPCSHDGAAPAPSYVGDNYYCESGRPTDVFRPSELFTDDPLWDGKQCADEGTCCTDKSPPWFSVNLPSPTTDDVEVRICGDESTSNEDTPVALMELYVQ